MSSLLGTVRLLALVFVSPSEFYRERKKATHSAFVGRAWSGTMDCNRSMEKERFVSPSAGSAPRQRELCATRRASRATGNGRADFLGPS
jgi:hypothetical protein